MVIAPHADDEVLGCGGYLLHSRSLQLKPEERANISIVVATVGGLDVRQDYQTRMDEFLTVCHKLESEGIVLIDNMDAMLDTLPSRELITLLDKEIDTFRPDEVFLNYRSRHQDHIKVYDCAMAALRLREGYRPKFVALYEYPFITNGADRVEGGIAYHDITDVVDQKCSLFNLYGSQVRQAPSPLNEEGIKSLAAIRGMECGCKYAEKFYVQKMML